MKTLYKDAPKTFIQQVLQYWKETLFIAAALFATMIVIYELSDTARYVLMSIVLVGTCLWYNKRIFFNIVILMSILVAVCYWNGVRT